MKVSTQNLNERGLKWLHGRAWFRNKNHREKASIEWCLGKSATSFNIGIHLHHGECDNGIMLHASIPWLFSIYFSIPGLMKTGKEMEFGASIHSEAFWLHVGNYVMESNSNDPWWRKTHSWYFPWALSHHKTEILDGSKVVFTEISGRKRKSFMEGFKERQVVEKAVSKDFTYTYVLKNGEVQKRVATVFVDRMTWRARWWPLIPLRKVRTSISVNFNEEVGEGTGSWKGGAVGCGYEMLPGETREITLRRMERERKFGR